jgi:hypothetical protein
MLARKLIALALLLTLFAVACGGDDDATPTPASTASTVTGAPAPTLTSDPGGPLAEYPGAVVGTWRTVSGETFVTESGTGVYYSVGGVEPGAIYGQNLFVVGMVKPIPNVHTIQAKMIVTIPDGESVSCDGTLVERDGRYFVESAAEGGCGSVELIEGDPEKLDAKVGQETGLTVRSCTVTKEGRVVTTDLDPDFEC